MTDGDCQYCGRPTDGSLCNQHTAAFLKTLGELPALMHELGVAASRQDRIVSSTVPVYGRPPSTGDVGLAEYVVIAPRLRSTHGRITLPATPWAFSPDAAKLLTDARRVLMAWARELGAAGAGKLAPERIEGPAHRWYAINEQTKGASPACAHSSCETIRSRDQAMTDERVCRWIVEHKADVARFDLTGDMMTALTWYRNRIEQAIDRRDPDVFLGPCDAALVKCGAELWAHLDDKSIDCPLCGWSYTVARRKDRLLAKVYDQVRPLREVADAVAGFLTDERDEPVPCTSKMIQGMAQHGRLAYRGTAPDGRSQLVRVGDVVEVLRERMEKDRARRARPRRVSA